MHESRGLGDVYKRQALYELDPEALAFLSLDEEDLAMYNEAMVEAVNQITLSMA